MHKAFTLIERGKKESGREFYARAFKEAGAAGDFYTPWQTTTEVVQEGYESPYYFGRLMRQYLDDDGAYIMCYSPTNVYIAFNGGTDDSTRAVLFNPMLRDEEEKVVIPARANGHVTGQADIDWYSALPAPSTEAIARRASDDAGATFLICDNCGEGVRPQEAHFPPSVIVEGAGVYTPVFCNDCWQKQGEDSDAPGDDGIYLTCDGCGRQVNVDDAYLKLFGPEDGVLCPLCFLDKVLTGAADMPPASERGAAVSPMFNQNGELYQLGEPYICDNCGCEVNADEAYVKEGVLCFNCWLDQSGSADQE